MELDTGGATGRGGYRGEEDAMEAPPETPAIMESGRTFSTQIKVLDSVNSLTLMLLLGMHYALLGQTLVDLEKQVSAKTQDMSMLFICRGIANFIGCMLAGPVYDRFNHASVLCVSMTTMGLAQICIPFTRSIYTAAVIFAAHGVAVGGTSVGVVYQLVKQWGKKAGPFLHCISLTYDIAAIIGPFVQRGFLHTSVVGEYNNQTGAHLNYSNEEVVLCNTSAVAEECAMTTEMSKSTDLLGLNLLMGGLMLALALVDIGLAISFGTCRNIWLTDSVTIKEQPENEKIIKKALQEDSKTEEKKSVFRKKRFVKIALFASALTVAYSLDGIMAILSVVYLVKGLHSTLQSALYVISIRAIACCFSKLPMVFLSHLIAGRNQVIIISILSTSGLAAMTTCVFWTPGSVWILLIVVSMPLPLMFPSTLTWASQEVKVTGIVSSIFNVPYAAGLVAGPALASFFFDHYGPHWFVYLMLIYVIILDVLAIITLAICHAWDHKPVSLHTKV